MNSLVVIHSKTYSLYNSSVLTATSNANLPWFNLPTWQYTRTLTPVKWCKITLSGTRIMIPWETVNMVYCFTIRCKMFHIIKQANHNCHQICRHYWWFLVWNCLQIPIYFFFNNWHVGKSYKFGWHVQCDFEHSLQHSCPKRRPNKLLFAFLWNRIKQIYFQSKNNLVTIIKTLASKI